MEDTGKNAPEDLITLLHQQEEMLTGERDVQMFPLGTTELPKLVGTHRYVNSRGVFHYWPHKIGEDMIEYLSAKGKENVLLRLGPYSKAEIAERLKLGESLLFVTEYSPMGVEIRSAAGTNVTCAEQYAYFESTKSQGSTIVVGAPPERVQRVLRKAN